MCLMRLSDAQPLRGAPDTALGPISPAESSAGALRPPSEQAQPVLKKA